MRINKLILKEFGKLPFAELDFADSKCICILGANGSGKTFLAESIAACLYGKFPSRFGSLYDFMSANESVIQGYFTISGRNLLITRRVSKTKKTKESEVSISDVDSGEILTSSKSSEASNLISSSLMPYRTFAASIFSSQRPEFDLCEERPESRRDLLASIAYLDRQQMASDIATARISAIDQEVRKLEEVKSYLEKKISSFDQDNMTKELATLRSELEKIDKIDISKTEKLKELRNTLSKLIVGREKYNRFLESMNIQEEIKTLSNVSRLTELRKQKEYIPDKKDIPCIAISEDIIDKCPLAKDFTKHSQIHAEISELEEIVCKDDIDRFSSLQVRLREIGNAPQCDDPSKDISMIEKEIDKLSKFDTSERDKIIRSISSIETSMSDISKSMKELESLVPEIDKLAKSRNLLSMLSDAWGRHGAQAHIIHEMTSTIAEYANDALSMLDMPMSVSIETLKSISTGDKKETITIMASHMGKVIEYRNLSGGESRAFQLAIRYGLCKYMMSLGIDAGMLVLDETFDKLDDHKSEMMMKLIRHISDEDDFDQVIFISHTMRDLALADGVIKLHQDGIVSTAKFERC